jgi:hypothetical protein
MIVLTDEMNITLRQRLWNNAPGKPPEKVNEDSTLT